MLFSLQFIGSMLLDFIFGDPRSIPHPVRGIGWLCTSYETATRKIFGNDRSAGTVAFLLVLLSTVAIVTGWLMLLHSISIWAEAVVSVLVLYSSVACRDLQRHSIEVYNALTGGASIEISRQKVACIVGRDTASLDEAGVSRATVETVAENLVDGVTAPIFFAILFSVLPLAGILSPISLAAIGAYFYKAINTMDSMYGYKNEQYIKFGTVAARIDDCVNFIPARITGVILVVTAWLLRLDAKASWRVLLRDRLQHSSPNAGHPEAAVAGALGIQLGGTSNYFGKAVHKPTIGDAVRAVSPRDIQLTNRIMFLSTFLFVVLFLALRYWIV